METRIIISNASLTKSQQQQQYCEHMDSEKGKEEGALTAMYHSAADALRKLVTQGEGGHMSCRITRVRREIGYLQNGIEYFFVEVTCSDGVQYGIEGCGDEARELYAEVLLASSTAAGAAAQLHKSEQEEEKKQQHHHQQQLLPAAAAQQ